MRCGPLPALPRWRLARGPDVGSTRVAGRMPARRRSGSIGPECIAADGPLAQQEHDVKEISAPLVVTVFGICMVVAPKWLLVDSATDRRNKSCRQRRQGSLLSPYLPVHSRIHSRLAVPAR